MVLEVWHFPSHDMMDSQGVAEFRQFTCHSERVVIRDPQLQVCSLHPIALSLFSRVLVRDMVPLVGVFPGHQRKVGLRHYFVLLSGEPSPRYCSFVSACRLVWAGPSYLWPSYLIWNGFWKGTWPSWQDAQELVLQVSVVSSFYKHVHITVCQFPTLLKDIFTALTWQNTISLYISMDLSI